MTVQQHALIAGPVTVSRIAESHEQFSHLDRWSCETIWGHLVPLSKGLRGQDLQYHDSFCFMWVHLVVTCSIIHNLSKAGLHPDSYKLICKVEGGEQVYTCVTTKLLPCCHPHDAVFPNKPSMVWSKKLKSNRSEQNNSQMYRITEQIVNDCDLWIFRKKEACRFRRVPQQSTSIPKHRMPKNCDVYFLAQQIEDSRQHQGNPSSMDSCRCFSFFLWWWKNEETPEK